MGTDRWAPFGLRHQTGTTYGITSTTFHYRYQALKVERPAAGALKGYVRCGVCGNLVPVLVRSNHGDLVRTLRWTVTAVAAVAGIALWIVWFVPRAGSSGHDGLVIGMSMVLVVLFVTVTVSVLTLANRIGVSVRLVAGSRWHSVSRLRPGRLLTAAPTELVTDGTASPVPRTGRDG